MTKHKIEKKVIDFIDKYKMVDDQDKITIGVSGGADSVCLLFVLKNLSKERNFTFVAVHVNHGLRGEAANEDEEFVKECCDKLDVPCHTYQINIKGYATSEKLSIEEAGRVMRRQIFEETMKKTKSNKVALAHHQNDNAETLLMNLARGSGIRGISGIKPVNGHYIRPLLCLTRDEVEEFLKEGDISFCMDETNESNDFTRNRIRNIILPNLEKVNPKTIIHMNETMNRLREIEEFVDDKVEDEFAKAVREIELLGHSIKAEYFMTLPLMIQKAVVKRVIEKALESQGLAFLRTSRASDCECPLYKDAEGKKNISRVHVEQTLDLFNKEVGKRINLPYGLMGVRGDKEVVIVRGDDGVLDEGLFREEKRKVPVEIPETVEVAIEVPGITEIPNQNIRIESRWILEDERRFYQPKPFVYTKAIDYDIIKDGLFLRTRRIGDWLTVDKKGSRQKLKSYFINEKIPRHKRDNIPLLVDGSEVVWVVGYRMNMKYQMSSNTKKILEIKVVHSNDIGSFLHIDA